MDWASRDINMPIVIRWRWLFLSMVVCAAPLFFIGGPSEYSLEIHRRIWDLGHPVFFACVSLLVIGFGLIKSARHFLIALLIVFVASLTIETLQTFVGREANWLDISFNLSGFLLGGLFVFTRFSQKLCVVGLMLAGLLPGLIKLGKSAMMLWVLWNEFPVLLSGQNHWEQLAWGSEVKLQPVDSAYRLDFSGKAYASADMMGFMQSWKPYQFLVLEMTNPAIDAFVLTLRISDKRHEMSSQEFADRFNYSFKLEAGKQQIKIPLSKIESAPANRKMDLDEIYLLKLFLPKDDKLRTLYLSKIYLE
jgi:hypothetical protein